MTHQDGFSLIELLVVVVIVAVVAGAAMLNANLAGTDDRNATALARMARLMELQCEQAILLNRHAGMRVAAEGYLFMIQGIDQWEPRRDKPFAPRNWPEGTRVRLLVEGQERNLEEAGDNDSNGELPDVACFSSGEMTPFEIAVTDSSGRTDTVRGDGLGDITLLPPS